MVDLEYDVYDIVETLRQLSVEEYSHTLLDRDDNNPPLRYVFGKQINDRYEEGLVWKQTKVD